MTPPGSKRPAQEDLTGREKRMVKNRNARRIDTTDSTNNTRDRVARLGNPLTKIQLANARLKQINTLQTSIRTASYAVNVLAFQSVPRDLRRRTASHDARRLPQKLRERAAKEIAKAPPVKRKPRRCMRNPRPKSIKEEYLRRQRNKKWLETHIWHTKRMKMVDIWGYRLAHHPNVKAERPCYRAFSHLSMLHDASYYGCMEWNGNRQSIVSILDRHMDPFMPSIGSARYTKGQRIGHGLLYHSYPTGLLSPVTFLWRHYEMQQDESQLWIWIHPSVYTDAWTLFQAALKDEKDVQLLDRRDELVQFEFTGPRSTALLQAVLDPVDDNSSNGRIWRDLSSLRSSSSLPLGAVLGLTVKDPRLSFPQKVPPRTNKVDPSADSRIQELCTQWPLDAAMSDLWDRQLCNTIHDNKPSDHSLALRRQDQKKHQPSTTASLPFTPSDASIPILLFQRGSSFSNNNNNNNNNTKNNRKEFNEGWTLIAPRGWGVSFWKSFVFAGARTCGLRDVRAMHFETGTPAFPYDFPGTQPWQELRDAYKQQATQVWAKKPPAKRINYELLGVPHPFEAAFETLVPSPWVIQEKHLFTTAATCPPTGPTIDARRRVVVDDVMTWESALVKVRVVLTKGGKPVQNATVHISKGDTCPIGYLTTAGFSLSLGCGVGNGTCTLTGLKKLIDANSTQRRHRKTGQDTHVYQLPVFVKNPPSVKYRPAILSLLLL